MRAVVQRVKQASVVIKEEVTARIGKGLVVFLGVGSDDSADDAKYLAEKIVGLRIFEDDSGKMNNSLVDVGASLLVVSQFTLYGDVRKGRRPSFISAAQPNIAQKYYNLFIDECKKRVNKVQTGIFQADMLVNISNSGPVTILLDSKKQF